MNKNLERLKAIRDEALSLPNNNDLDYKRLFDLYHKVLEETGETKSWASWCVSQKRKHKWGGRDYSGCSWDSHWN
jgi:hypothetical protein